ncbi:MobF family relaxase [Desulfovibrio aminophilus]|uniref:MobF family relaxase n=1 Tax=Desulfovibrio aminophilus TaxID=81425 RepID=UPI003391C3D9
MGIARLKNLAKGGISDYYSQGKDDYYQSSDSDVQLLGTGVEQHGLSEGFSVERFEALNEGANGHYRKAKDLTLSPPKSVSLLYALGDETQSKDALEAHRQAVQDTIDYIEHCGMVTTRIRDGDSVKSVPARGLVVACFEHSTNRNQDPNLHSHCLIANACTAEGAEGITNLNYHAIYRNQKHLGQVYDSALINDLTQRGYTVREKGKSFELEGIGDDQIKSFSSRKADIEQTLKAQGLSYETASDDERQKACFATRRRKETINQEVLLNEWQKRSKEVGLDFVGIKADRGIQARKSLEPHDKAQFVRESIQEASELDGIFTAKSVYGRVIRKAREQGQGISPREVERLFKVEASNEQVISLPNQTDSTWINHEMTTVDLVEAERDFVNRLQKNRGAHEPSLPASEIEKGLTAYNKSLEDSRGYTLKDEQADMVRHILGSKDLVSIVQGDAGTGKTTALDAVASIYGRNRIIGLALQAVAASNLECETGISSSSIDKFLNGYKKNPSKIANSVRGCLIVIDEAAMVGSRKMNQLGALAAKFGAKLCLVGDTKQLASVGAGAPMALAISRNLAKIHYLRDIRRQKNLTHLEAIKAITLHQQTEKSIFHLQSISAIKEHAIKGERHLAIAQEVSSDWANGIKPLVIVSLNKDRLLLNLTIRRELKAKGFLQKRADVELDLNNSDGDTTRKKISQGELIIFTKNNYRYGIENGNLGHVKCINKKENSITVNLLKNNKNVTINLKHYNNIDYAYAISSYKSQGQTVKKCIYDANSKSKLLTKEEFYVGISRHNDDISIYTDSIELMRNQLKRQNRKKSIAEILEIIDAKDMLNNISRYLAIKLRIIFNEDIFDHNRTGNKNLKIALKNEQTKACVHLMDASCSRKNNTKNVLKSIDLRSRQ